MDDDDGADGVVIRWDEIEKRNRDRIYYSNCYFRCIHIHQQQQRLRQIESNLIKW